jgi:hypothetical protein
MAVERKPKMDLTGDFFSGAATFGTETIFGLAVGGLCPRFNPTRCSLAQTALRLHPSRVAARPALWPLVQSCF